MTTAISVPFHGNTLFVVDHNGQPYTPMKPIVDGMGLSWQPQHAKLKDRFGTSITEIVMQMPGDDQRRSVTCMAMRKLAGWLMTIHPNKVNPEIRDRIIRYQNECDDALWDYWTKGQAVRQNGIKSLESSAITASEQQTLSEIVDVRAREYDVNVGKAKAEIWSRLHNKFRIAKYSQLPREQLADAIAYVMQMTIKTPKVDTLASMIQFSRAASDITNKRFLVSFVSEDRYVAKQLPSDVVVTTPKKFAKDIRDRGTIVISNDELIDLAFASIKRLQERADMLNS